MQLFDLHCDTLYECYTKGYHLSRNPGQVDLVRAGSLETWVQGFALWIPDRLRGEAAWDLCRRLLSVARREEEQAEGEIRFLRKGERLDELLPSYPRIGFLAVEGGAAVGDDLSRIRELAAFGVKYITITWNGSNEWGNGCLSPDTGGLTPFGKEGVRRCREAGILPDVSHLNEASFWDLAETAEGPILATHSNAAALVPHPRNLTDPQFEEIRRRGGLVGLNLAAALLGEQTLEAAERHLCHFWERGGEDTVCLGCDLDGTPVPARWNGMAIIGALWAYLIRKNYDTELLRKLFFGNCYNFFKSL